MLRTLNTLIVALAIVISFALLGGFFVKGLLDHRGMERTVNVKGLSEQEFLADTVIWPIQFVSATNNLEEIYQQIDEGTQSITQFLESKGITADEITVGAPSVTDKSAQTWSSGEPAEFRYTATQTITVYSNRVEEIRAMMSSVSELGRQGIALSSDNYQARPEYLFTRLNDVKPDMIEEATKNAREVAEKFADDSNSELGKIKYAQQGLFSIQDRDQHNPHLKKVRVVTTVEYYLSD